MPSTYADLALSAQEFGTGLTASVTITNTGTSAGREIVQLYVSAPAKSLPKPALELRGFAKTKLLAPADSQTLSFTLTTRDLAAFDEASSSWAVEAATYTVKVGASSEDIRQTSTFAKATDEKVGAVAGTVRRDGWHRSSEQTGPHIIGVMMRCSCMACWCEPPTLAQPVLS